MTSMKQALFGGITIFVVALIGTLLIGRIYSDVQAKGMIEAMAPSIRTLSFAIITASATVISLLLTTVGFAQRIESEFDSQFYEQIKMIARLCSISLILSVSVLLTLTIPLTEAEALRSWFTAAYYLLIFCSATLAALVVSTIILLFQTMNHIISKITTM